MCLETYESDRGGRQVSWKNRKWLSKGRLLKAGFEDGSAIANDKI